MRPKLVSLLAVSAIALVGCSSAAQSTTDAPQSTATSSPTPIAKPTTEPSAPSNEEAFIEAVELQIEDKEEALEAGLPAKKMTEEYWLERGEIYCEQQAESSLEAPRLKSALENRFEGVLMSASLTALCPTS